MAAAGDCNRVELERPEPREEPPHSVDAPVERPSRREQVTCDQKTPSNPGRDPHTVNLAARRSHHHPDRTRLGDGGRRRSAAAAFGSPPTRLQQVGGFERVLACRVFWY